MISSFPTVEASGFARVAPNCVTNTRPDGDRTLENEFTDILNIGKIFDVQDKAQAIVDDAKAVIDKTLTATADVKDKPSVMVLEPLGDNITNYGVKSLGGDMVTQLGATLANPDIIPLQKFRFRPGYVLHLHTSHLA